MNYSKRNKGASFFIYKKGEFSTEQLGKMKKFTKQVYADITHEDMTEVMEKIRE